jgi:hypothetical protein
MMNLPERANARNENLFEWNDPPRNDKYPRSPGWKGGNNTSRKAADAVAVHAGTVRARVLAEYARAGADGMTADQCAKALNVSILTTRPRATELLKTGLLTPTGERRQNDSGMSAVVLRITEAGIAALPDGGRP